MKARIGDSQVRLITMWTGKCAELSCFGILIDLQV